MLNPQALMIGIEIDGHWISGLNYWNSYVNLHIEVYSRLKVDFPNLVIGASIEHPYLYAPWTRSSFEAIYRYVDGIFLSSYPYGQSFTLKQFECFRGVGCQTGNFVNTTDGGSSTGVTQDNFFKSNIFESVALYVQSFGKLWGIHESGYINTNLNSTAAYYGFVPSTPNQQARYMKYVMSDLNEHNGLFIINWASINYEPLMDYFAALCGNNTCSTFLLAMNWEYTGLLDGVKGATDISQLPPFVADNIWYSYFDITLVSETKSGTSTMKSSKSKISESKISGASNTLSNFYFVVMLLVITVLIL